MEEKKNNALEKAEKIADNSGKNRKSTAKKTEKKKAVKSKTPTASAKIKEHKTRIGLLWEEATHCAGGDGYTIRYASYSVEQITDNRYRLLL